MTHEEKVAAMYRHLPALGIGESMFAPPVYKGLWAMGWKLAPPPFAGAGHQFVAGTIAGVLVFAICGWLLPLPLESRIAARYGFWVVPVVLGLLTGLISALCLPRWFARYRLPAWSDYRGDATS